MKGKKYKVEGERDYFKVVKGESSHTGVQQMESGRAIEMEMGGNKVAKAEENRQQTSLSVTEKHRYSDWREREWEMEREREEKLKSWSAC